jgi:alpha-2-macroglobulin
VGKIRAIFIISILVICSYSAFATDLEVLSANPQGELQNMESEGFDKIQILFSDAMVNTLDSGEEQNKLPDFLLITPSFDGRAYWGSDRMLNIVPKDKAKVPYSTKYTVTVKKGAKSLSGQELPQDYTFSFTTPMLKIVSAGILRTSESWDSPILIAVFFNQPIKAGDAAKHLIVYTEQKPLTFAPLTPEALQERQRREPEAAKKLADKIDNITGEVARRKVLSFHMLDKKSEKIDSFIKNNFSYVRGFSEDMLLLIETDVNPPAGADYRLVFDVNTPVPHGNVKLQKPLEYKVTGYGAFILTGSGGHRTSAKYTVDERPQLIFSKSVNYKDLSAYIKCWDVTENKEIALKEASEEYGNNQGSYPDLSSMGLSPLAGHHYLFRIDENLKASDGEPLGYPAYISFEFTLGRAYVSFGEGEGVWESSRGTMVPFYSKNVAKVEQKMASVSVDELVSILQSDITFEKMSRQAGELREIKGFTPDKVFNAGLELKPYLNSEGKGIVWASIGLKQAYKDAPVADYWYDGSRKALIQVTDLGMSLKYSPEECLVYVTSLSAAQPVPGCQIELRDMENRVIAASVTDEKGIARIDKAPFAVPAGEYASYYNRLFVVIAKKGNDTAYIVNDWADGMEPWRFEIPYSWNLGIAQKTAGIIFTDRGVYKLGEEVHYKVILRKKVKGVFTLYDEGSEVTLELIDPKGKAKEKRTVKLSSMSSADGIFVIPKEAALGNYEIAISFGDEQKIYGSFMVAAYRKPDFKVNVELSKREGQPALDGKLSARYLFGAPLAAGEVKYHFQGSIAYDLPKELEDIFPGENWNYHLCWYDERNHADRGMTKEGEAKLDANGELKMSFPIKSEPVPMQYSVETEVTDITRQSIAGSATTLIYPKHFIGLYEGEWSFRDYKDGINTKVAVMTNDGKLVPGADVEVELSKMVWRSSNSATGESYYEWDSNYDFEVVETRKIKSADGPVEVSFKVPSGGEYIVRAKINMDGMEQAVSSSWWFYGGGYTPWERSSDNKIDVMVEKPKYKPGETAKIFIKSPWEKGRILLTTERETVRTYKTLELTSTQQMVEIPLTEEDIPNIFVSVILLKGRSGDDENDKPAFRIGYAKLSVENEKKKLKVEVSSDKEEYRPADKAKVKARVTDIEGKPVEGAEVTLWAVDVGVLNLTNYKTPDPSKSFWAERPLSVFNADSREKLISARVSVPKGEDEGGGGGMEYGRPSQIRKDFRVLAFWVGSALTDKNGTFEGEFLLPESLTAFRIMAVAHDRSSRFGSAEKEFIVSQSLLLTPAFPRFLTTGDEAYAGVLLNSRLSLGGAAKVKIESLTPSILSIENGEKSAEIAAKGKAELRCKMKGLLPGTAKIRVTAELLTEKDAFEIDFPVNYPLEKITKVQCGEFAKEVVLAGEIPSEIYPTIGELEITISQNVLAELKEGYNFIIEYPYGCAEQRSSKLSVLLNNYTFAKLIGRTDGKEEKAKQVIVEGIKGLGPFQRDDGGFGVWVGDQVSQPYLTAYICHLLQRAKEETLLPDEEMLSETVRYLQDLSSKDRKITPEYYYGWYGENAFSAKVIAEAGGNADPIINSLMESVSSLPMASLCHLWDAAVKSGKEASAKKLESLIRSKIVMSGQKGFLKENRDENYFYYWLGDDMATAACLKSFIANTKDDEMQFRLAKFLVEKGRIQESWNTHRNAIVYEALTAYARRQQEVSAKCSVSCYVNDGKLFDAPLGEKSGNEFSKTIPMAELLKKVQGKFTLKLAADTGDTLHYAVKLRYAPVGVLLTALDRGIAVKRSYTAPGSKEEKTSFTAGEMAEVHLELTIPYKSYNIAVVDPLPAGFEILDSAFATTARKLKSMSPNENQGENNDYYGYEYDYYDWWWFSGFRQIEKHDDKVILFADYLAPGKHQFTYLVRATSTGEFRAASTSAEEMYDASVNGRGQGVVIKVIDGQGR